MKYHAHLLVHVGHPAKPLLPIELIAAARMAASVKKQATLAQCDDSAGRCAHVRFLTLSAQPAGRLQGGRGKPTDLGSITNRTR